jgi:hypothetical membrane protein
VRQGHRQAGSRRPGWASPAWGGIVGPAAFVATWAALGATRSGYSPVEDAISRLAETGTTTRPAMTAGFVVYGVGLAGWAAALRSGVEGPAWIPAAGVAAATVGVAAFPLRPDASGAVHAAFAVAGYAALAAVPLVVAAGPVLARHPAAARLSVAVGVVTAGLLVASAAGAPAHGLTQRAGLTLGDGWVAVSSALLLRQAWGRNCR